jgi:hypothetical protein
MALIPGAGVEGIGAGSVAGRGGHGMEGMVPLIGYDGVAYGYISAEEAYHHVSYCCDAHEATLGLGRF